MNVILLTVLALGGAGGGPVQSAVGHDDCGACGGRHGHHCGLGGLLHGHGCWCGAMPQTCYDPAYGCYPGTRFMNRYPAFHGSYYRRPYNYRNVFDYPWHADLHEPTSFYSYNVSGATGNSVPPAPEPLPMGSAGPLHRRIENSARTPSQPQPPAGRTLRR